MRPRQIVIAAIGILVFIGLSWYLARLLVKPPPTPPPGACVEAWECSEWSNCLFGRQVRFCKDANECGTEIQKPLSSRRCGEAPPSVIPPARPPPIIPPVAPPPPGAPPPAGAPPPGLPGAPAAPTGLNAVAVSHNRVTLHWQDNAANEDGFRIERSVTGGAAGFSVITSVAADSLAFNDLTVSGGTTYWYRVRAFNSSGESLPSNVVSVLTQTAPPPPPGTPPPTGTPSPSPSPSPTGGPTPSPSPSPTGGPTLSPSPTPGTTPDTTPPVITVFSLTPGPSKVTIDYAAVDPAPSTLPISYILIRHTNKGRIDNVPQGGFINAPSLGVAIVTGPTIQQGPFIDTSVAANITYWYRLEACDSAVPSKNCKATASQSTTPTESIAITLGNSEKVWDWSTQTCGGADVPDAQARAVKNQFGKLVLSRPDAPENYFLFGDDFNSLKDNCAQPVLVSGNINTINPSAGPDLYDDYEWIASMYRIGNRIHAIVHNEYHDPRVSSDPPCKSGDASPANPCNYTNLTYAFSDNGGRTFQSPDSPGHILSVNRLPWDPYGDPVGKQPTLGHFQPSNIVKKSDGFYYSLFQAFNSHNAQAATRGTCVMRTDDLGKPANWRAWDGAGFNLAMPSPYQGTPVASQFCAFVSKNEISDLAGSLTYNTYLQKYLLVGTGAEYNPSKPSATSPFVCGFFFSTSVDLINWTPKQLLRQGLLQHDPCQGGSQLGVGTDAYPSIIDHGQLNDPADVNFEKSGNTPHVYYTHTVGIPLDRDLMRIPLTICEVGKPVAGLCP